MKSDSMHYGITMEESGASKVMYDNMAERNNKVDKKKEAIEALAEA